MRSRQMRAGVFIALFAVVFASFPPTMPIVVPATARAAAPERVIAQEADIDVPLVPVESEPAPLADLPPDSLPARAQIPDTPVQAFGDLPLSFELHSDANDQRFIARGLGGVVAFTPQGMQLDLPVTTLALEAQRAKRRSDDPAHDPGIMLPSSLVDMRFEGANANPVITGTDRLPGMTHYFLGNDITQWRSNVPNYGKIVYQQLYPGIDLVYEGVDGTIKGTYYVAPGVDPAQIRWRYSGGAPQVDGEGRLQVALSATVDTTDFEDELTPVLPDTVSVDGIGDVSTAASKARPASTTVPITITEDTPVAWQIIDGAQVPVQAQYAVQADGSVQFALASYDPQQELVIDPSIVYSTPFGGDSDDWANDIAVDSSGAMYVVGWTRSSVLIGPNTTRALPAMPMGGSSTRAVARSSIRPILAEAALTLLMRWRLIVQAKPSLPGGRARATCQP
ncbi:hypothetical protein HC891_20190 [Candidatus Gracilibacteria bacterium]|nr:hypothetical protein [Candidatus Gracilibacteria bacterium]